MNALSLGITSTHQSDDGSSNEAEEFLRRVAEATGILIIHSREAADEGAEDVVSFMHHSFLEYYAAVGFLAREFEREVPTLANHPYWRDVITLMFGLLSEHQDVSRFLTKMIQHED